MCLRQCLPEPRPPPRLIRAVTAFGPIEPTILLPGLQAGDLPVRGPGEIFAPARRFNPIRDPLEGGERRVVETGDLHRLRVHLAVVTFAVVEPIPDGPRGG